VSPFQWAADGADLAVLEELRQVDERLDREGIAGNLASGRQLEACLHAPRRDDRSLAFMERDLPVS